MRFWFFTTKAILIDFRFEIRREFWEAKDLWEGKKRNWGKNHVTLNAAYASLEARGAARWPWDCFYKQRECEKQDVRSSLCHKTNMYIFECIYGLRGEMFTDPTNLHIFLGTSHEWSPSFEDRAREKATSVEKETEKKTSRWRKKCVPAQKGREWENRVTGFSRFSENRKTHRPFASVCLGSQGQAENLTVIVGRVRPQKISFFF